MSALGCGLGAIHPTAWNMFSANFRFTQFYEVALKKFIRNSSPFALCDNNGPRGIAWT
jgi:hypothetical protein